MIKVLTSLIFINLSSLAFGAYQCGDIRVSLGANSGGLYLRNWMNVTGEGITAGGLATKWIDSRSSNYRIDADQSYTLTVWNSGDVTLNGADCSSVNR